MRRTTYLLSGLVIASMLALSGAHPSQSASMGTGSPRAAFVLARLAAGVCSQPNAVREEGCHAAQTLGRSARRPSPFQAVSTDFPNGTLIGRLRLGTGDGATLDLLAYASDGLIVAGIACYPDDGKPHATVVHIHGGTGGLFVGAEGNMVQTCIDWAVNHQRTAFMPSLRGQDGGDGRLELCLGEANDVAAGVALMRTLEITDPNRVALVGGSIGGCVALRAAPLIPNLRAVVAFVPPTDWKSLMAFHRSQFSAATETLCDGTTREWTIGGPGLADVFDGVICGHPECNDADYAARSPIPGVLTLTAPTLIVAAGSDNIVPLSQQVLWSIFRQSVGHDVHVYVVDKCDVPGTPPADDGDGLVVASGAFHLLAEPPVVSGLSYLLAQLDRP